LNSTLKRRRRIQWLGEEPFKITRQRGIPIVKGSYVDRDTADCECKGTGVVNPDYLRLCGLCKVVVEVRRVAFSYRSPRYSDNPNRPGVYVFNPTGVIWSSGYYDATKVEQAVQAALKAKREAKAKGQDIEYCVLVH
jgi:hypothetical protein